MKLESGKDDAVSPVVGVMLMLTVTIIIAAVVAAFAGGLGGGMQSTPSATFSVNPQSAGGFLDEVILTHKGGDTLSLPEIELQLQAYGETKHFTLVKGNLDAPAGLAINPGDDIVANTISDYLQSGTPITWSIIDNASGNKIATGNFVVP
ncbi:MAG TPA: type IV pilin N-terminal domain-containing protein [Methanocorpusculum sp.]|nr:type IV pilin N-terminal domain-containing protein [Methanocorpusculum sp.]